LPSNPAFHGISDGQRNIVTRSQVAQGKGEKLLAEALGLRVLPDATP
jgi:hypothetical protein